MLRVAPALFISVIIINCSWYFLSTHNRQAKAFTHIISLTVTKSLIPLNHFILSILRATYKI